jgi:hypothetical protein
MGSKANYPGVIELDTKYSQLLAYMWIYMYIAADRSVHMRAEGQCPTHFVSLAMQARILHNCRSVTNQLVACSR